MKAKTMRTKRKNYCLSVRNSMFICFFFILTTKRTYCGRTISTISRLIVGLKFKTFNECVAHEHSRDFRAISSELCHTSEPVPLMSSWVYHWVFVSIRSMARSPSSMLACRLSKFVNDNPFRWSSTVTSNDILAIGCAGAYSTHFEVKQHWFGWVLEIWSMANIELCRK